MKILPTTESDERTPGTKLYVSLGVLFVALVVAGVFTVALPELANDPDASPDAGVRAAP
jgi:hypothetical protein